MSTSEAHISWRQIAPQCAKLAYVDFEQISMEFVRALRGKRSQPAFSRRLGYKSNVAYTWESGRGAPTASRALQAARRVGVNIAEAYEQFYRRPPVWLSELDPASPEGVAAFLNDLRGNTSIVDLAEYSGKSRFAISRWLKGTTEPKLPEFFLMIECASLRLVDFLESLVNPVLLPSIRDRWEALEIARRVAYDEPWTQAVLRALELDAYKRLKQHQPGWIAAQIGIDQKTEERCLKLLDQTGQIRFRGQRWESGDVLTLDTRKDPAAALRAKTWWGQQALERVQQGQRGMVYNLFGVSAADLERLRELQKAYFNELRTIVAQSEPVERVALATVTLVDLGESNH